jgi:hypothetical protein
LRNHAEDIEASKELQEAEVEFLKATLSDLRTQHQQTSSDVMTWQRNHSRAESAAKEREAELTMDILQVCNINKHTNKQTNKQTNKLAH